MKENNLIKKSINLAYEIGQLGSILSVVAYRILSVIAISIIILFGLKENLLSMNENFINTIIFLMNFAGLYCMYPLISKALFRFE